MLEGLLAGLQGGLGAVKEDRDRQKALELQEQTADRERSANLEDYKERLKFSMRLQEQMEERKIQLAQTYPEYSHYVTSPVDGSITGFTKHGAAATLKAGDPDIRNAFEEDLRIKREEASARRGLLNAQAQAHRARASSTDSKPPPPIDPSERAKKIEALAKSFDPEAFSKPYPSEALLSRQDSARKQAAQQMDLYYKQKRGGASAGDGLFSDLVPSPEGPDTSYTDLSNYPEYL